MDLGRYDDLTIIIRSYADLVLPRHGKVSVLNPNADRNLHFLTAGLTDAIAEQVYDALAYHVTQANMNRRFKAVSAWSLQMTAQAVINALRNIVDPISVHIREVSSDEQLYLG